MSLVSLHFVEELAREAGALVRSEYLGERLSVEHKGSVDLVTSTDLAAEALLVERIRDAYPGDGIWAEERGIETHGGDRRWILDPIDGTTNFVHRIPHFSVLVAVQERDSAGDFRGVHGAVYDPMRDEMFSSSRGGGARCNGTAIGVSNVGTLRDTVGATGFPYDRWEHPERDNHREFCALSAATRGVRRFGSAGLDFAYVAAGRFDFYWEGGLKPWDMAAGILLCEEAGARVTTTRGGAIDVESGDALAANPKLHGVVREALRRSRSGAFNDRDLVADLRDGGADDGTR